MAIDLLVYHEHWETEPRTRRSEVAVGARAVDKRPLETVVAGVLIRCELLPAPGAVEDLIRRTLVHLVARLELGDRILRVFVAVGGRGLSHPETDRQALASPDLHILEAEHLTRTKERQCTLKLLDREESQRVAHEHRCPCSQL